MYEGEPYIAVARLNIRAGHEWGDLRVLRKVISTLAKVPHTNVVIRVSRNFGRGKLGARTGEWLSLEHLKNVDRKHLSQGEYKLHIEHFKKVQDSLPEWDSIWLYTTDEDKARRLSSSILRATVRSS